MFSYPTTAVRSPRRAQATARLVVVVLAGSPVEMPWLHRVPCVLLMGLPGQAVGGAMADVLFGSVPPGGKLAETWPLALADCPSSRNFARQRRQACRRALEPLRVRPPGVGTEACGGLEDVGMGS